MKKRLSNNKGFSLVELIIVVAIMAILIGILAPQYMKYVEKSRLSADNDTIDAVRKACETAMADPDSAQASTFQIAFSTTADATDPTTNKEVAAIINGDTTSATLSKTQLKSKSYKNATSAPTIDVTFTKNATTGEIDVTVTTNNIITQ